MPRSRPAKDRETKKSRVLANRYEVIRNLGSGNYGTVFLCKDMKCNDELKVLKEIAVGDLRPDETVDANSEAKLLSKLNHPSILKFYDSFIDGEFFCIVTEYCEDGDLDHKIDEYKKAGKSFDENTVLDWTIQLLLAAHYIHCRRVLHRDLKARNIFIQNNRMKIGDFGISRILMGTIDMASTFTGTPYYMSPEVLKHEGYNSKSDVWSIGCIMYELCTLEHAFTGQGLMGIMYKIVEKNPPDIPSKYSKELNEVYKKMLNKNQDKRPSAADVLKIPYMARHMAKMKETMTDEYKGKHITSPEIAVRDANEIASVMREKSYVEDLRSTSEKSEEIGSQVQKPSDKKLTAREKLRLKKMQEADNKAKMLKIQTKIQRKENAEERQKNKVSLEKTNLSPWKGDSGEDKAKKQSLAVKNEDKHQSTEGAASGMNYGSGNLDDSENTGLHNYVRRNLDWDIGEGHRNPVNGRLTRSFSQKTTRTVASKSPRRMIQTISGTSPDDRPIAPMRDKMVYGRQCSSLDFKDGIPDTPDQADTFYEQYSEFEDEGDNEETVRNNDDDFINCLEAVLNQNNEELTIVNDDIKHGAYGPNAREKKIKNLRAECVKILGQEGFEKAYNYLKTARSSKERSENKIMEGLTKFVKNHSDCFLVDQLLFLEEQDILYQQS